MNLFTEREQNLVQTYNTSTKFTHNKLDKF